MLGNPLQVKVDGQLDLLAGNCVLRGQGPHFLSHTVHDNAALAVSTHQDVVVLPLEAEFAGEVTHAQLAVACFDLLLAHFTYVSRGVSEESARQITPAGDGNHFEDRDVRTVRFDEITVCWRSVRLDDDGLEFWKILCIVELVAQIIQGDSQAFRNSREVLFDLNRFIAKEKNAEGWPIVDQHAAIAVQHAAARRDNGNFADAVALSHRAVFVRVNDLQLPEAEEQHADHSHDDVGGDGQPRLRQSTDPAQLTQLAGLNSRHEKIHSVGFELTLNNDESRAENVRRKFPRTWEPKKSPGAPESPPDRSCVSSKSLFKRIT